MARAADVAYHGGLLHANERRGRKVGIGGIDLAVAAYNITDKGRSNLAQQNDILCWVKRWAWVCTRIIPDIIDLCAKGLIPYRAVVDSGESENFVLA